MSLIFSCSTNNPKLVIQSLTAISWKEQDDQYCSVNVSPEGILFVTEDSSTIQASVLLRSNLFSNFFFSKNDSFEFRLNLSKLVKCLGLFSETANYLEIKSKIESGSEIEINIIDPYSITTCKIMTHLMISNQGPDMTLSKLFGDSNSIEVASFLIQSSILKEMFILPELTQKNSLPLTLTIDSDSKIFEVKAEGSFGFVRSSMDFGILIAYKPKFDLTEPLIVSYPISSFIPVLKAMNISSDTRFRFKGNGMLSAQQAISNQFSSNVETVVEFILQPIEENLL